MTGPTTPTNSADLQTAQSLGEVKGQLTTIMSLLQHQHADTNRRIDDMRRSVDGRIEDLRVAMDTRFDGVETAIEKHEGRLERLEQNERATAMKAASLGTVTAFMATAAVEAAKALFGVK